MSSLGHRNFYIKSAKDKVKFMECGYYHITLFPGIIVKTA